MIRMSEMIASERGYEVIFSESQWDPKRATRVVSKMIQSRIEGIILCFSEKNEDTYHLVQQSGLPHVAVDTIPAFYSGSYILNDGYNTGYLAAQHLCTTGCKHIAIVNACNDLGDFSSIDQMERGFNLYLEENHFPAKNCIVIKAGLSIDSGKQAYRELKRSGVEYDGIFCMNDLCAMGFMHGSKTAGTLPGRDYAIIGVDNNDVSDLAMISLSSIYIDYDEISAKATNYLIDQIDGNVPEELKKIVKPRLIERSSTALFRQQKES